MEGITLKVLIVFKMDSFFKGNQLYIPNDSIGKLFIKEVHNGSLAGYSGIDKNIDILKEHLY